MTDYEKFLPDLLIVSQTELLLVDAEGISVEVTKASGEKCQRCWIYHEELNAEGLCPRCAKALKSKGAAACLDLNEGKEEMHLGLLAVSGVFFRQFP